MRETQSIVSSLLVLIAAAAATSFAIASEPGPAIGATFPHSLAAPDQSGKPQTLETLMGAKGLAVFFVRSADWCPFCKRQLVDVNAQLARFRALGLNVVSVSVDDIEKIAEFAKSQSIGYEMLADPDGAINLSLGIRDEQYPVGSAQFGVPRPTLYVIDRNKTVRLRYMEPTYRTRSDLNLVLRDVESLGL
jgi:peroxiredoxin